MITLTPAYGRDYKSKKEVVKAFRDGKDFLICGNEGNGTYCNAADLNQLGGKGGKGVKGSQVKLRYARLRRVVIVDIPDVAVAVAVKIAGTEAGDVSFEEWMKEVDRILVSICELGTSDLRDRCYRDGFDSGASAADFVSDEFGNSADAILEEDLFG